MKRWLPGFLLWIVCLPLWANSLDEVRIWPTEAKTRVVLDVGTKPEYSYFSLKNPDRLVIDLRSTQLKMKLPLRVGDSRLLTKVRTSTPKQKGELRLVLELTHSAKVTLFTLGPSDGNGDRLVIDLTGNGQVHSAAVAPAPKPQAITPPARGRDIIIAIDPGHGGHDPGSIGRGHVYEKNITLAIAKKLRVDLDRIPGIKAVMTRSSDHYIGVVERADIARKKKADMLVSIHADSIGGSTSPRGASVWVLNTNRANRVINKWVDEKDRHSELLGGAAEVIEDTKQEQYLAQALLDMSMDHSRSVGQDIGSLMLKELSKVTRLHKNSPQPKSLGVLTAPDIPSVLVETGFLSNPSDEKLLNSSYHQGRIANALAKALKEYFSASPPPGTLFAQQDNRVHVVKSGDSLSALAARYNTSVAAIKAANGLHSNTLLIGQKLTIPSS
ncbi:N-acetylmuramoyl-L-alanine amidase [Gallaecimonas mangrovi]|uniref:N-acetylmuramoyl-L-alanine amidase n=1 Tax=Gallaecimonas mangrovi TaxID=2291597 RepID=UPI000E20283A|nr:N-acetylmuramoyl-L-alanine amidase [Gallaecimonas mangrovi]